MVEYFTVAQRGHKLLKIKSLFDLKIEAMFCYFFVLFRDRRHFVQSRDRKEHSFDLGYRQQSSYKTELRAVTSQTELLTRFFYFIIISELLTHGNDRSYSEIFIPIKIFELVTRKLYISLKIRVINSKIINRFVTSQYVTRFCNSIL